MGAVFTFALPYTVLYYFGLEQVPWAYPTQYWGILATAYIIGQVLSYFLVWRGRREM